MAIRHNVTIQVAPGRARDFAGAFSILQASVRHEDGPRSGPSP